MPPKSTPKVQHEDVALPEYDEEEYEEIIEETIIEEIEEEVEELIVLRIKNLQGMSVGSAVVKDDDDSNTSHQNENKLKSSVKEIEDGKISLSKFDTTNPLLTFENGLVLEGKWHDTQGNLAVVGVEKESERNKRRMQLERQQQKAAAEVRLQQSSSQQQLSSSSSSQQDWAPTLSQRIRSSQQETQNSSQTGATGEKLANMNDPYIVNGLGTPTRLIVFQPSKEKTLENLFKK